MSSAVALSISVSARVLTIFAPAVGVINRWAAVQALLVRFCVLADIMQKPSQSRSFANTEFGSPCRRLVLDLEQVLP